MPQLKITIDPADIEWRWRPWGELSRDEIYDALKLRCQVFIVEQQDPYNDIDGYDPHGLHLLGYHLGRIVANGRLLPPDTIREEAVIGRLVVDPEYRGHGLCKTMIMRMLRDLAENHADCDVYLYMQTYWMSWLLKLGAVPISAPMSKSRIEHVEIMIRNDIMKGIVNAAA